jgi:ABC-2 type transport system permease protein
MNHVLSIARKELRAYFLSPIALIFIGTFLFVTLFTFFWVEGFFVRNIADIRPLFAWFPILLIFLVGAMTMRLWSEEQKLGTLEILLTLPVEIRKLVLGKFLGGLGLVALALALTLSIPITVSMIGDLDWGPVIGGYLAALLLASAYLAIGLCISALTENQIIALILTVIVCSVLYVIGTPTITSLAGVRGAEMLHAIGVGSRFESIERGVIDVRDVVYYLSLTTLFLMLNTVVLESKRWSMGGASRPRRVAANTMIGLAAANLLILNVWLANAGRVRVDLTERNEYSISDTTKDLIRSLEAPLVIRGYFSEKTHPLLDPLIPRIRDLVEEYAALSGGKVKAEFVDPRQDQEVEKEANEVYAIKSFPFKVEGRHEQAVVNAYFSILLKYGDQHAVLGFGDLIEVQGSGMGKVEVKLRNLEYDLTKTIKKVAYGFQTIEAMFADLSQPIEITAFVTPKTLPQNFKDVPTKIENALKDMASRSSGKLTYRVVDPDAPENPGMRDELFKKYGFRPMAASLFSQDTFYLHLLMKSGDKYQQIFPSDQLSEAQLKEEITAAVKRSAPGFLKTVGLMKPKREPPPQMHQFQQPPPPQDMNRLISESLQTDYTVKSVELTDGRVPGDVDVLVVIGPENLDEKQAFAIDQYLMAGGGVIVLGGKYDLNIEAMQQEQGGLAVKKVASGLDAVLAAYGVTIQDKLILDPQNEPFPVPVVRNLGGLRVQDIQLVRYPFFVDVRQDGMSEESPVTGGLPAVTMNWASPVVVSEPEAKEGEKPAREVTVLLRSSPKSWAQSSGEVSPDFQKHGELGFPVEGERKSYPLAVAIRGRFESAFKDKPSPLFGGEEQAQGGDRTGRTLKSSPDTARLVVIGSSTFLNDYVLQMSRQASGDRYLNNVQLVQNLIDWAVADVDLLAIRSRGTFARTLLPLEPGQRNMYEYANYGLVAVALAAIIVLTIGRRRRLQPIALDPAVNKRQRPTPPITGAGAEVRS